MSSKDLVENFDVLVKKFKQDFDEIVEFERAKLKSEVETYNAEKLKMKAVSASDEDVISINVGGQRFTTFRSTLCQVEGSLLASMFSGRWEDGLKRDSDGVVFLDFNPQYFSIILDYLRAKKIATPKNPPQLDEISPDQKNIFQSLVEYLGLAEELVSDVSEKFNLRSEGVTLPDDGKVALNDSSSNHRYVLGEKVYKDCVVRFDLKLESFQNNNWMLLAILKDVQRQGSDNRSYSWPGCFGWAVGNSDQVYRNGSCDSDKALRNITKQGDTVQLVLNCNEGKLSLHLPTGQKFVIEIEKDQTWRLHVNLYGANDRIRIVAVTLV